MKRPRSDEESGDGLAGFLGGSATTLNTDGKWAKRKREFAPGFHGANPGPSHEDDAPSPPAAAPVKRRGTRR